MSIASLNYLLLVVAGAIIYYIVPKRAQWGVLLAASMVFYWFAGTSYTFLYIVFSAMVMYLVSNRLPAASSRKRAKTLYIIGLVLLILPWFLTSAHDLWLRVLRLICKVAPFLPEPAPLPLAAAIGMGYYTAMTISYLTDCYWENIKPQKNPLKMLLYVCFFPQLTAGPISRYSQLTSLFEGHSLSYENLTRGAQRILWGICKKLVLAERLGMVINLIWSNLDAYPGMWRWFVLVVYPLYIYADFSGCLDIVIGTARIFGITLPENFNNPFFSRTIQEFWQRWHITLGLWARDYVMYPILKSESFVKLGKKLRKKIGKRASSNIMTAFASGMVWLVMGLWHGGLKFVFGVSIYFWLLLELGKLSEPLIKKLMGALRIRTECFSWHLFQSIRTYIIYSFGAVFFAAPGIESAFEFFKGLFTGYKTVGGPWIFFDGSIPALGLIKGDIAVILLMTLLVIIVAALRERHGYAANWMAQQGIVFRWMVWFFLIILVIAFGNYGMDHDVADFIYQGF